LEKLPCKGLEFGKTGTVKVANPNASGPNKWIEFDTRLDKKDDGFAVGIATYTHLRESRERVCLSKIDDWKEQATTDGENSKKQLKDLQEKDKDAFEKAEALGKKKATLEEAKKRLKEPGLDEQASGKIYKEIAETEAAIGSAPGHTKELLEQIESLKSRIAFAEGNVKWCDGASRLLKTLQRPGRLHYRMYADVEGMQVDIARTRTE